jgi:hypothetical protein
MPLWGARVQVKGRDEAGARELVSSACVLQGQCKYEANTGACTKGC